PTPAGARPGRSGLLDESPERLGRERERARDLAHVAHRHGADAFELLFQGPVLVKAGPQPPESVHAVRRAFAAQGRGGEPLLSSVDIWVRRLPRSSSGPESARPVSSCSTTDWISPKRAGSPEAKT